MVKHDIVMGSYRKPQTVHLNLYVTVCMLCASQTAQQTIHGLSTAETFSIRKYSSSKKVTYLLKTFFSSLERAVFALCFRSLRLGYFFFFPFPFLPTLSEPRFSPVVASMSRISSASRQSTTERKRDKKVSSIKR